MTHGATTYNERSWGIDLIGHLKEFVRNNHRAVRSVGGELTIKGGGGSLFPDVLLFGDPSAAVVVQGWELKMPDTPIDDPDFRSNAEEKARRLGLNSFVLWNVRKARLFAIDETGDTFQLIQEWDDLDDVAARSDVKPAEARWALIARQILDRVNELLERGDLTGRPFVEAYRTENGGVSSLLTTNCALVAEALSQASRSNATLRAEIELWWARFNLEYERSVTSDRFEALAQANLVNWLGKLLFAHVLRQRDNRAASVASIGSDTSPEEALRLFESLSELCNFWTIFCSSIGLATVPETAWSQLKQFNNLLSDLNVGAIDQEELSRLLEAAASVGVRKLRGQYVTPKPLADLLVRLTLGDRHGRFLDPCCGSGTIARAAVELKLESNVPPEEVAAGVFAGDLDAQAIQLATFAMAKPALMRLPLRIFGADAFQLTAGKELEFRNPEDGSAFTEELGTFQAIASNLPFVAQIGRKKYGSAIDSACRDFGLDFTNRADVAAYLPFALHGLLEAGGRLGIIITNAWLGTEWGRRFREKLDLFYALRAVVTSGAGRWFQNSDVIANLLILEKREYGEGRTDPDTNFVVLKNPLDELRDPEVLDLSAAQIELGQCQNDTMSIRAVSRSDRSAFEELGLLGNAQFVDVDWVLELPLRRLADFFDITRGERRGWNDMFYPAAGHGIEADYIRPAARSSADITGYVTQAETDAFSCSLSIDELERLGHHGALAWIARFRETENLSGKPLPQVLERAGHHWYEMRASQLTELVTSMAPGDRLFVARLSPAGFVDQRLIRITPSEAAGIDTTFGHAILNSTLSLFMLEGIGFPRGLGALDLNPTTLRKFMHIVDLGQIDEESRAAIAEAFVSMQNRDVLEIADELEQTDRRRLDELVLEAIGAGIELDRIYESMRNLVALRQTAIQ